jgi:hypothetical protein
MMMVSKAIVVKSAPNCEKDRQGRPGAGGTLQFTKHGLLFQDKTA